MALFAELKRRNVFRVAAAYTVTAWLAIQVVETIFPAFGFGDEAVRNVTIAFAIGLVPVLVLAWVFELTPEGLKRDSEVDHGRPASLQAAKRLDRVILAVLALALGYFAFDKFVLEPQRVAAQRQKQAEELAAATEEARAEGRSEALVESFGDQSIAVLPFRDMSPDGDQEYLSEGIAEELLNVLARVPDLRVISRTSSFAFKGQALEVPEIARRLKVAHVLEGSVRKAGDTIRITAQLIEARSDTHLWSQTWDRRLENVFAIQDEIANQVAESLRSTLLAPADSARPIRTNQTDPRAFELVLRGRYLVNQAKIDAYRRAVSLFEQAIEIAPDYAPAHAWLAKALRQLGAFGAMEGQEAWARVDSVLDRALELDPQNPDALTTRGMMVIRDSGFGTAREYWRRAIAINPNDADAYRWLGWSYRNTDSVRYLDYIEKGYRVAPTNVMVNTNMVWALARFERYDDAWMVVRDLHALDPARTLAYGLAGELYRHVRRLDLALKSYYRAFRMAPGSADSEISDIAWLLLDSLASENYDLMMAWNQRQLTNNPNSGRAVFQKIIITWLLGRGEEAGRLLEELEQKRPGWWIAWARCRLFFGDYQRSREWWESGILPGQDVLEWDAYRVVDYAFVLQQTGDRDQALQLIDAVLARMGQQMDDGVRREGDWDLRFYMAILHSLKGEVEETLAFLREDAASGGLSCALCLDVWPHFNLMRDDPEFKELYAEQMLANERWRQRLEAEGLLLTPDEVLALDDFEYDPFAEYPSSD